mgnify:CR=1 FL=1|jgi:hypothetical protein
MERDERFEHDLRISYAHPIDVFEVPQAEGKVPFVRRVNKYGALTTALGSLSRRARDLIMSFRLPSSEYVAETRTLMISLEPSSP